MGKSIKTQKSVMDRRRDSDDHARRRVRKGGDTEIF